jgi:hypothetical protein
MSSCPIVRDRAACGEQTQKCYNAKSAEVKHDESLGEEILRIDERSRSLLSYFIYVGQCPWRAARLSGKQITANTRLNKSKCPASKALLFVSIW